MNRRDFIRALGIGAGAVALAPVLPFVPAPPVEHLFKPLKLHPDAFKMLFNPPIRMDVLYGVGVMHPDHQCQVMGA